MHTLWEVIYEITAKPYSNTTKKDSNFQKLEPAKKQKHNLAHNWFHYQK